MSGPNAILAVRALQKQRARLLYRRGLKNVLDWAVSRDIFYPQAAKLRNEFEANKDLDDISRIENVLLKGEARLQRYGHPDPYLIPWGPGGSKYVRNPPVPPEIEVIMDYGRGEDL